MDPLLVDETTALTATTVTTSESQNRKNDESILTQNRSKYIALLILLLVAGGVGYGATNYTGPTSNPTTESKISISNKGSTQPHVIWFIADDLGQSDISLHGSDISTPNIDDLAKNGIELTSHYVMPLCSPSRASFLTGRHSFRLGLQATMSDLVKPQSIAHIPSSYKLASEYFSESGYDTYAYGKWHVGYSKNSYTPTNRGFNHHNGFYQFAIDYTTKYTLDNQYGYDWFNDGNIDWDKSDESLYTTFILTDKIEEDIINYSNNNDNDNEEEEQQPLFMYIAFQNPHFLVDIPESFESSCDLIKDDDRREYCAHVQVLDYAVGKVISLLKKYNLYDNSLIAFTTDNGALSLGLCGNPGNHMAAGSAYPYRGGKYTLFEGGVNTPAILSGNIIPNEYHGKTFDKWFQAADWLPTLLHFTNDGSNKYFNTISKNIINSNSDSDNNIDNNYFNSDGYDMYSVIFENDNINSREEKDGYIILNIDYKEEYSGYVDTSIIYNDYKMIYNHELYLMGSCDVYSAKPFTYPFNSIINEDITSNTNYNNLYLFNLKKDKTESNDLLENKGKESKNYNKYKNIIDEMFIILDNEKLKGFMTQQDKTSQTDGDSDNFNGAWLPWQDENEPEFDTKDKSTDMLKMHQFSKPQNMLKDGKNGDKLMNK